jgi:hypothetical protein
MQARLIVHAPEHPAELRWLRPGDAVRIGRGEGCDLRILHGSVSRDHARLRGDGGEWWLLDAGSKNGSFLHGERLHDETRLPERAWLRFGDVFCEFAVLGEEAAASAEAGLRARRAEATAHTARIEAAPNVDALLDSSLRGAMELAQCERGFVLLREGGRMVVRASLSLDAQALRAAAFSGSAGALNRALNARRSVVANDIGSTAWLAERASVAAAGLSALVCLPLLDGDQVLGAIYVDRVRPGPPVTTLDMELLEAFAERAALWIAARRMRALLETSPGSGEGWAPLDAAQAGGEDWDQIAAAHADLPR